MVLEALPWTTWYSSLVKKIFAWYCYLIRVVFEKCSDMCVWISRFGPNLRKWVKKYRKLPLKNTGDINNLPDGTILVKTTGFFNSSP